MRDCRQPLATPRTEPDPLVHAAPLRSTTLHGQQIVPMVKDMLG